MTRLEELAMRNPWLVAILSLALGLIALRYARAEDVSLKAGDPAPQFSLPGSDGRTHTLADLKGRAVVIAWFPKAFTGG
jgi:peroxiredoxin Q/BCP